MCPEVTHSLTGAVSSSLLKYQYTHKKLTVLNMLPEWPQMVKNLPSMQKTLVQSLGWEDPLERMTTHSNTYLRIPRTEKFWQAPVSGVAKSDMTK